MTITCGIINSDPGFDKILLKLINQKDKLTHIQTFGDVQSGLNYLKNNKVDLLLVNPVREGFFIKVIDLSEFQPMIVLQVHPEYALQDSIMELSTTYSKQLRQIAL